MGWSRSEIRRDRSGRLHRLAPCGGAPGGGPRGARRRLATRTTTSARARSGTPPRSTCSKPISPSRRSSRSWRAPTASSTSPASRACARAGARASSSTSTGTCARRQRVFEAAADGGRPRRLRVVLVRLRRRRDLPDPGGRRPAADLPVRDHEARLRAPRRRDRAGARARRGPAAVLHGLRPAAAARHGVHRHAGGARAGRSASGSSATAARRGASRTSATPSTATIAAMERGRAGAIYNVGGGDEATMNEAIALARGDLRARARRRASRGRRGRREAHQGGREQGRSRPGLGARDGAARRAGGAMGMGLAG